MISLLKWDYALEQNNQALWAALPWLFYCVRVRWEQTWFLFNECILSLSNTKHPPASVCVKAAHSDSPCSLRGINNPKIQPRLSSSGPFLAPSLFHSAFLPPTAFFLSLFYCCCSTDRVVSPLMFVLWSRISKQSINLRWALRLFGWQLSCCMFAHTCCMVSAFSSHVSF